MGKVVNLADKRKQKKGLKLIQPKPQPAPIVTSNDQEEVAMARKRYENLATYGMPRKKAGQVYVDLACGKRKPEGFLGVDISNDTHADVIHDLEKFPWPFQDASLDFVVCSHYIEHTGNIIAFMDELYRVTKPGSYVMIKAPYYTSVRAMQDPTHKNFISEPSFIYYNKKWREENKLDHYGINADFDIIKFFLVFDNSFKNKPLEELMFCAKHYWNTVGDITALLYRRKSNEPPKSMDTATIGITFVRDPDEEE